MDDARFMKIVEEALDNLPAEYRKAIHNVAVLVEDVPPEQRRRARRPRPRSPNLPPRPLVLGVFAGVPLTKKSVFALSSGPDHIVLYKKNLEAVCRTEDELRRQILLTVMHELGHYFGLSEEQLKDV